MQRIGCATFDETLERGRAGDDEVLAIPQADTVLIKKPGDKSPGFLLPCRPTQTGPDSIPHTAKGAGSRFKQAMQILQTGWADIPAL